MFINRALESKLDYLSKHFPVVLVTGARQVGKTTLLKRYQEKHTNISYVTLDYPALRMAAREDPALFLQQYPTPLIIDEIQYVPELLTNIKIHSDKNNLPGQYFLTGSQLFYMMKDVSESLAGRVGILTMYSLSRAEIDGRTSVPFLPTNTGFFESAETSPEIFQKIFRGGMPKMITDEDLLPEDYFGSYMQTYIERDIRDLIRVKDESKFIKFLSCMAARVSQEVNLTDVSKDTEIDRKTAEGWLSILVTSGLVYLLPAYSGNTIKRIVKRPKLYFMDTGLACYLSLWNNPRALEFSAMAGAFFEDYVISEIIKSYANSGIDPRSRLCYYRDSNGKEIDLLILENGQAYPIEIKKSASPKKDAIKNFHVLDSLPVEIGNGAVVCLSPISLPLDGKNQILPLGAI